MSQSSLFRDIVLSTIAATLVWAACGLQGQETVKPKPTEQTGFDVIGIEARTNNSQESGSDGAIPKQWQRLFMEGVLDRIPDRLDQSIIAVYTNYASDWNGDYTYILGARVRPGTKVPAGMVAVNVPVGKYIEFVSARGPAPQVVPETWKQIWTYFHEPGGVPPRAYQADFERYEEMSDPNNVQVRIYIGVKP
jgi:predicted transcriptional regulator YdeE